MKVSFDSWIAACEMARNERKRLRSYLQWYPFHVLVEKDWEHLESKSFYSRYIKDCSFILCKKFRFREDGLVQKSGFAFRDSKLVSPIIYIYILAFVVEYQSLLSLPYENPAIFYAGDIERRRLHYGKSYRAYCQALKICSKEYDWCIKTDLSHFFGSINVDSLISIMIELSGEQMKLSDVQFFRGLLLYCGKGGYPTIQNHAGLSFLATKVYLNDIDESLSARMEGMKQISDFCLVRYVDDLYIFFDAQCSDSFSVSGDIVGTYADVLRRRNLSINPTKTKFLPASDVATTIADVSQVDFFGLDPEEELPREPSRFVGLFSGIASQVREGLYTEESLDNMISSLFRLDCVSVEPKAVFHNYVFSVPSVFRHQAVIDAAADALMSGKAALSFSTEIIVLAILNTRSGELIKSMLNELFKACRGGAWTSVDSLVAVTYLRNRSMVHHDLLEYLQECDPAIYSFIDSFCLKKHGLVNVSETEEGLLDVLDGDRESKTQYVLYLYHESVGNIFESASYYRAFFDRFSSYVSNAKQKKKKMTMLYREKQLAPVYSDIERSEESIRFAEDLRQKNPLVHAGAETLRMDSARDDLKNMVKSLHWLMIRRIEIDCHL